MRALDPLDEARVAAQDPVLELLVVGLLDVAGPAGRAQVANAVDLAALL